MASCAVTCALIFLQTLFGLIGFLLLAVGLFVRFFADSIWKMIKPTVDQALKVLGQSADGGAAVDADELLGLLKQISIPLIVIGAILFLLSILGCCGTCCRIRTALLVYGIILVFVLCGQLIATIVIGVDWPKYRGMMVAQAINVIKNEYSGVNSTNIVSMFFNFAFMKFECCGVTTYKEMKLAKKWNRKLDGSYFVPGNPKYVTTLVGEMQIPATCCKSRYPFPAYDPYDVGTCLTAPNSKSANIDRPCFAVVDELLEFNKMFLLIAVASIFVVQLVIIILVFCLRKCLAEDKKVRPV